MILRSIELDGFGMFCGSSFEFRRGLNLVTGPNESGKTTLAAAVSGTLFGLADAGRMVPGGKSDTCRAALTLENGQRIVRIARDLLTDEVSLEERDALHQVSDRFQGRVPVAGGDPEVRHAYQKRLVRFFNLPGGRFPEEQLRFLLGDPEFSSLERVGTMLASLGRKAGTESAPAETDQEPPGNFAELEAALGQCRKDFAEGVRYLEWARNQWDLLDRQPADPGRDGQTEALQERRRKLEKALADTGLPQPLPSELPVLLAEAAEIREDLVTVGRETARLREDLLKLPRPPWRAGAAATLAVAAVAGGASFLLPAFWSYAAGAGLLGALVIWAVIVYRGMGLRAQRARLQGRGGILESQRAAAQEKMAGFDERFEKLGLSPSAVAVARMQKNLERGRELMAELAEVKGALQALGDRASGRPENLLSKRELAEAETKLAGLEEEIRRRERELADLARGGGDAAKDSGENIPGSLVARPLWDAPLDDECNRLLLALTGGRCGELALEAATHRLLVGQGEAWMPLERVGRGTRSCVLLTLRLTLLQRLRTTGALPLVLDEPCAGLDRDRQPEAVKALERRNSAHQIILCSHDENLLKRAARDRWNLVPLEESRATSRVNTEERNDDVGQLHLL